MEKRVFRTYAIAILGAEAVGALSGLLSRAGIEAFSAVPKSALTPPAVVFPVVWTILYALMGIGAARVWLAERSEERSRGLWLYVFQLIFNFFWSLFFFNMRAYGFSLLWLTALWVLIFAMMRSFYRVDKAAGLLQIPYLVWVAFAGYLNYAVWVLNK